MSELKRDLASLISILFMMAAINTSAGITIDEQAKLTGEGEMSGYTNSLMKEEFRANGQQEYGRVLKENQLDSGIEVEYNSSYRLIKADDETHMIGNNHYPGMEYFDNNYKISTGGSYYNPSHEISVNNLKTLQTENTVTSKISTEETSIKVGNDLYESWFGKEGVSTFTTDFNLAGNGSLKERISDIGANKKRFDIGGLYINGSFVINSSVSSETRS